MHAIQAALTTFSDVGGAKDDTTLLCAQVRVNSPGASRAKRGRMAYFGVVSHATAPVVSACKSLVLQVTPCAQKSPKGVCHSVWGRLGDRQEVGPAPLRATPRAPAA